MCQALGTQCTYPIIQTGLEENSYSAHSTNHGSEQSSGWPSAEPVSPNPAAVTYPTATPTPSSAARPPSPSVAALPQATRPVASLPCPPAVAPTTGASSPPRQRPGRHNRGPPPRLRPVRHNRGPLPGHHSRKAPSRRHCPALRPLPAATLTRQTR